MMQQFAQNELQAAMQLLSSGRFQEAEARLKQLVGQQPADARLLTMISAAQREQGKLDEALATVRSALQREPGYAKGHMHLGVALLKAGDPVMAASSLEQAIELNPRDPETLTLLGRAYIDSIRFADARKCFDKALRIAPDFRNAFIGRAILARKLSNDLDVIRNIDECEKLGLRNFETLLLRAQALSRLKQPEEALALVDEAEELSTGSHLVDSTRGRILQTLGRFEEAVVAFKSAIEKSPIEGWVYETLSRIHKFATDDPLIEAMQAARQHRALSPSAAAQIDFALFKAFEDCEDYETAFGHLEAACEFTRRRTPFNREQSFAEFANMKTTFAGPYRKPVSKQEFAPIFVTGLPRSGTTLVERILNSHSQVGTIGEPGLIHRSFDDLLLREGIARPAEDIEPSEFAAVGKAYEAGARALEADSPRVLDKSIQSYLGLGVIWQALPHAKMVITRRDPRDNLLSIYKNAFPEGTHLYSYDFDDLAFQYRQFCKMLDFWREKRPDGFYEIEYEQLTHDPETEIRKLLEFCELPFEEACLNSHEHVEQIETLSLYQARQPIYRSSVNAWKRYEKQLQPLFEALDDLLPEDVS